MARKNRQALAPQVTEKTQLKAPVNWLWWGDESQEAGAVGDADHTGHPRDQRVQGGYQALGWLAPACGTMPPSRVTQHSGHKLLSIRAALKAEGCSHLVAPNSQ